MFLFYSKEKHGGLSIILCPPRALLLPRSVATRFYYYFLVGGGVGVGGGRACLVWPECAPLRWGAEVICESSCSRLCWGVGG